MQDAHKKGDLGLEFSWKLVPTAGQNRARITGVFENSPAHIAGLLPEDVVIAVNGKSFNTSEEFMALIAEAKNAKRVTLKVTRDSQQLDYTISLSDDDRLK